MKKIKIKKLYKGYASVRGYIIEDCLEKKIPLQITYKDQTMTLEGNRLLMYKTLSNQTFSSLYSDKNYKLYDYVWTPDIKLPKDWGKIIVNNKKVAF